MTVNLESGQQKLISAVNVGYRILVQRADRSSSYSTVVFTPHGPNSHEAVFNVIETSSGRLLSATPEHLVLTSSSIPYQCSASGSICTDDTHSIDEYQLQAMQAIKVGDSIVSVDVVEKVIKVHSVKSRGIYTVVTEDEHGHVVVNGIVASSFGTIHWLPNAYYNIHRMLHRLFVSTELMESIFAKNLNMAISGAAINFLRYGRSLSKLYSGGGSDTVKSHHLPQVITMYL